MKKTVIIAFAAVFLFVGMISGSIAGHHYHGGCSYMKDMSTLDGNQDNMLSLDEFSAPQMENLKSAFNMLDTDKDGFISAEEWNEFLKVHGYGEPVEG
jgi:hypothetical protein